MKYSMKFKFFTLLSAAVLFIGSACNKVNFGEINKDPNRTVEPITSALLTNVLSSIGNNVWDAGGVRTMGGLYAQYFSETQYTDASRYSRPNFNFDLYPGVMYDLQNIINYNSDPVTAEKAVVNGSNANQLAIARILRAYYFKLITDLYGDVPYTEALKGKGDVVYDTQDAIYPALLAELKGAIAQFDGGLAVKGDIMYNGEYFKMEEVCKFTQNADRTSDVKSESYTWQN